LFPTIEIGFFHLSIYDIAYSLAITVGCTFAFYSLLRRNLPVRLATHLVLLVLWVGIAGAFLGRDIVFLLLNFVLTGTLAWPGNGSAFMGALAGAIGAMLFYCRRHALQLGQVLDTAGLSFPLGQAIGRLGCFAAGCCYGKATESWLGMYLRDIHGIWMVRYPTQLLSSVANLLIFLLLLGFERCRSPLLGKPDGWPFHGFIFLLYVDLYTLKRFSIEFLRGDSVPLIGPFSLAHLVCSLGFSVSTALMLWNLRSAAQHRSSAQRSP